MFSVLVDDTGSTGTSYVDTDVTAETQYVYRIKARNAAGLSNESGDFNASTPEAPGDVVEDLLGGTLGTDPNGQLPDTEVPPAPTLSNTAAFSDGSVLLQWSGPEDDSVTGYRILRGADADSLEAIVEDTGSTDTTYTDNTAPAGQTVYYAVQARNEAGLSPLSNTQSVTTQASEEELETAQQSDGTTLVSNLDEADGTNEDETPTGAFDFANNVSKAVFVPFTTGASELGFLITHLDIYIQSTTPNISPYVAVHSDDMGSPRDDVLSYIFELPSGTTFTTSYQRYTFAAINPVPLAPNTTYWLELTVATGTATFRDTASDDEDSDFGWTIGNQYLQEDNEVDTTLTEVPKFRLRGREAIPEECAARDGADPSATVNIPDSRLRAAIESALDKSAGATITRADMRRLNKFRADDRGIANMEGLQFATRLTVLSLSGNRISSVIDFCGMERLQVLDLSDNRIGGSVDLSDLTTLRTIWVGENSITNLTLPEARNLINLSARNNHLTSITLQGSVALARLDLSDNNLSSINLTQIGARDARGDRIRLAVGTLVISLGGNNLTSLNIPGWTGIQSVVADRNNLTSVTVGGGADYMSYLNLSNNDLTSVNFQGQLDALESLYINYNAADLVLNVTNLPDNITVQVLPKFSPAYNVNCSGTKPTGMKWYEFYNTGRHGGSTYQNTASTCQN